MKSSVLKNKIIIIIIVDLNQVSTVPMLLIGRGHLTFIKILRNHQITNEQDAYMRSLWQFSVNIINNLSHRPRLTPPRSPPGLSKRTHSASR